MTKDFFGFELASDLKGEPAVWIRKIKINNFKSLVDFELDLAPFNCLIGLNGSGKSTVLQAIDFLAQLVRGDVKGWLKKRRWLSHDLTSRLLGSNFIDFSVSYVGEVENNLPTWSGRYDVEQGFCISETFSYDDKRIELKANQLSFGGQGREAMLVGVIWKFSGSVFSSLMRPNDYFLKGDRDIDVLYHLKKTKSFDMLSPQLLRRRTRENSDSIGYGGEHLAAFLSEFSPHKRLRLINSLQKVYPNLADVQTESSSSSWKQIKIHEKFGAGGFSTEAAHINDGLLRLTALLAMLESSYRFLLFDEIENGINSELIKFVIEALIRAEQQILVTTHSPMILNFLDDDVARKGVLYLDKREDGTTRATPFFKIPSLDRKLAVMGPGEAFVDTDLLHLGDEIDQMAESR